MITPLKAVKMLGELEMIPGLVGIQAEGQEDGTTAVSLHRHHRVVQEEATVVVKAEDSAFGIYLAEMTDFEMKDEAVAQKCQ